MKKTHESHRIWVSAGRPRVRQMHDNWLAARARYKRAIRNTHIMYERKVNDRLFNCLIKQDSQKFRRDWKRYYGCHNKATIISDYSSNAEICECFANSFKNNFKNSDDCLQ